MRKILLFGAGKSATVLIDYLLRHALAENWTLTVVDANLSLAEHKIGNALSGVALSFDITNEEKRRNAIRESDIVISLLPPSLHFLVAKDCLQEKKNLLTASYVDDQLRALGDDVAASDLLFLCEMGLDPGIDHMSAKQMIDEIHEDGGVITSFLSHCGGLVAPESDDNPWRYKISWNPGNVVNAGKAGAIFKMNGEIQQISYKELFNTSRSVNAGTEEPLSWYPNRDSLPYITIYGLDDCDTFIRTTLRHPDFMYGWKNVIDLHLTDEEKVYETDGKSLMEFFREHMERHGFGNWLQQKMQEQFESSKKILEDLVNLVELEGKAEVSGDERMEEFMMVTEKGNLQQVDLEELKTSAAATVANKMHEAKLTLKQLFYLGMDDGHTIINQGRCSAADVLRFALEKKLALLPGDKDLVLMIHEIEYEKQGRKYLRTSQLSVKGKDNENTAMAKTVGLPLAIAARLILNGQIGLKGLRIPIDRGIYEPVMAELAKEDLVFRETVVGRGEG